MLRLVTSSVIVILFILFYLLSPDVKQSFHDATGMSRGGKMDKLVDMLKEMDSNHQRTLIFVETKKLADVVAGRLSDEERMSATSMHGDRSQEQREMALDDFRRGEK